MKVLLFTKKILDQVIKNWQTGNHEFSISCDLGKSTTKVKIKENFLVVKDQKLDLTSLKKIKDNVIYMLDKEKLVTVMIFCKETNMLYKLVPTKDYPSFTIAGSPMHQITFSTPKKDVENKIKLFGKISENAIALDTCFGLGYTAIELAKKCKEVYTFENNKCVIEIAKINPYSQPAFQQKKIKLIVEDVNDGIKKFEDEYFDIILHDPPTFKIAPNLYSRDFYKKLFRVLKKNGLLYHYTPMPGNKKHKRNFPTEVKKRLKECGFFIIKYSSEAQGFLCRKN